MWYLYPDLLINLKIRNADNTYFVSSFDNNERKYFPEELIRQLLYIKLVKHYGFSEENLKIEYPIQMGITKKRADIVVFYDDLRPYIIAETKVKITDDSKEQLKSYINITRASYGVLASPSEILFYKALDGMLHEIQDIPVCDSFESSSLIENNSQINSHFFNMHGFESLTRINEETSKIRINAIDYIVDNSDLLKYDKIKKIALTKGVLLPLKVSSEHWHKIIETLFQNAVEDKTANEASHPIKTLSPISQYLFDSIKRGYLYELDDSSEKIEWECESGDWVSSALVYDGFMQWAKKQHKSNYLGVTQTALTQYLKQLNVAHTHKRNSLVVADGKKVRIQKTCRALQLGKREEFKVKLFETKKLDSFNEMSLDNV